MTVVLPDAHGEGVEIVRALEANLPVLRPEIDAAVERGDAEYLIALHVQASVIERYLETQRARASECGPALEVARRVEVALGELLGPGVTGRPRKSDRDRTFSSLPPDDVTLFRRLARHRERIEERWGYEHSRRELLNEIKRYEREHTPAAPDVTVQDTIDDDGRIALWHGDFRERFAEIPDGSVDMILTDPPYPADDLPLWSDLAKHAARVLGPRGLLVAYTGQIFLPEVMERVGEHLTYGWVVALTMPGTNSRIMGRHIIQSWKPILVYSTGTFPVGAWHPDTVESPQADKGTYEWQQNAIPAQRLIEWFCPTDGLIVDPFMGVGSFGYAARATGRRFIGVEMDSKRFGKAHERVMS